jgi:hypothetical protein
MATILIDYENVCSSNGFKGTEYLNQNDNLIVFYSDSCSKLPTEHLNYIEESSCKLSIFKLLRPSKNALDFYIATECGRISATGEKQIIIVSKDKVFYSIIDYFAINKDLCDTQIIISPNIERGLKELHDSADSKRCSIIESKLQCVNIETGYTRIKEKRALNNRLTELISNSNYSQMADSIIDFYSASQYINLRDAYLDTLHTYGRADGTNIYNIYKEAISHM